MGVADRGMQATLRVGASLVVAQNPFPLHGGRLGWG